MIKLQFNVDVKNQRKAIIANEYSRILIANVDEVLFQD